MKKIKTTCHICEGTFKTEAPLTVCPRCGADLANPAAEAVQKQVHCQFTSGSLGGATGWLYLTNLRLLWVKDDSAAAVGGALGGLVGALAASAIGQNGKMGTIQKRNALPLIRKGRERHFECRLIENGFDRRLQNIAEPIFDFNGVTGHADSRQAFGGIFFKNTFGNTVGNVFVSAVVSGRANRDFFFRRHVEEPTPRIDTHAGTDRHGNDPGLRRRRRRMGHRADVHRPLQLPIPAGNEQLDGAMQWVMDN